ncbi:peroxiredoxin [Amaricoccus solimangrovi]|uniref:thioredoxin-dependent peroxiredoxin n=1 Tax=Amaricoccus solimangrovi TaxID=2589815 RepID=A0A501X0B7_9RHOB|nr:peroxiredoxin [Amaricoccus solimangrovi]TPE52046.1 peroxiredoxin [Amaricoccus solimangrovi]
MLEPGDTAPAFTLPRDGGGAVSLADFAGGPAVVYFYPRDDTPGCTTEAVEFSAGIEAFAALGAPVIGISKDSVASHEKFRDKHRLGVILASDEGSDTCERYGVWGEKSMYGKTFLGVTRATFLIGADGKIARVWPKVKVAGHVAEVLAALRAL